MGKGMIAPGAKTVPDKVIMPTEKSKVSDRLEDYSWLLFGKKKIGKTTLAAQFPNVFFFPTEPGGKAISAYQPLDEEGHQKVIETWSEFCGYVEGYRKKKKTYGPSCVDVVDKAYQMCFAHMCDNILHIEHPNDEKDYGKSWQAINNECMRVVKQLVADPRGCVLISHAKVREVEDPLTGATRDILQCTLSGRIHDEITGIVDIWAYYGYKGNERRLYIRGSEDIDCGVRLGMDDRFVDSETGDPLEYIPMGGNPKESYENLLKAFANELSVERHDHKVKKGGKKIKIKK
jgi:hypothetical protein